ncbi:MAG: glycoside hydrolase family 2 protein [Chloroflexi bacterium]|nr:glycoside hydrolase family 2 protein [Chloroflexota bacterium]
MRSTFPFNQGWLYCAQHVADSAPDSSFVAVTVPHSNVILPYHNFDDEEYQFVSTYRKHFTLTEPLNGRRAHLEFEGVMTSATVRINGHAFPEHRGGFVPFTLDITDHLNESGDNLLTVYVDSTERKDVPPFGHTVDYLVFGGIYRDVTLRLVETAHIENVFVKPRDVLTASPYLEVDVTLRNVSADKRDLSLYIAYGREDRIEQSDGWTQTPHPVTLEPDSVQTVTVTLRDLPPVVLWTPEHPQLYRMIVHLGNEQRSTQDRKWTRFGFREARFKDDGFYLNGERLQLVGLNRHQNYPFIGAAAPARLQRKDADILKDELGVNIVRTSHYPQSPHFLDRCDEIGLLVFEEIPGWQHIGDEDWQSLALRDVRAMVERDRNHPSIIMWGVRINESWDNTPFYTQTNALARTLDPTRQTGGVRFFLGSEFLEDVYTFNDFSNTIVEPEHTPHLVTEYSGHMFPTKTWDHDARRVEHALRHARIQDRARGMGGVSGAIGWCAFDYNTHREFGAGDRICYHGVMDIFRLPKYAAYAYLSQTAPQVKPVLKIASGWKAGDYDEGHTVLPVRVFTNCDYVEAHVGDVPQGKFYPDREHFPHLPHPPILLTDLAIRLAQPWNDLRVVGFVGDKAVIEQSVAADGVPARLEITADDAAIKADGIDMTRISFRITDHYGNVLPYAIAMVTLEVDGPADIFGETSFPLVGGQGAVYLKSRHTQGEAVVLATTPRLHSASVRVALE